MTSLLYYPIIAWCLTAPGHGVNLDAQVSCAAVEEGKTFTTKMACENYVEGHMTHVWKHAKKVNMHIWVPGTIFECISSEERKIQGIINNAGPQRGS